jgi:hypothetical protein
MRLIIVILLSAAMGFAIALSVVSKETDKVDQNPCATQRCLLG